MKRKAQGAKRKIKVQSLKFLILSFSFALFALHFSLLCSAEEIQKSVVAGGFYPANPEQLKNMVDNFIDKAQPEEIDGEIIALILPHAGYEYSGWVAGYGAKLIKDKKIDTVIVIGLSHRAPFKGLSVLDKDFYQTPLGEITIDKGIAKQLIAYSKNISYNKSAFTIEHSAEVEIPFLQRALSDFKIVIMLTGDFSYGNCLLLRDALTDVIKSGNKKILLIASSDMSHYHQEEIAKSIDMATIKEMEKFQPETLFTEFLSWPNDETPCGLIGIIGVMMAAKNLGANELKVVKYATSADTTFDRSQVVGYCSAVMYRTENREQRTENRTDNKENAMDELLNEKQKKQLLEIARQTLESYIKKGQAPQFKEDDPVLNKEFGAFVTLHKYGELRGCIGNMVGRGPLYLTIRDMTIVASSEDPRFLKVTPDELADIDIEISVLSPMEKITDPSKIIMGKHGVLVQSGFNSGVFLPQVATETGWDRDTFMNNLCLHKAGLAADAWKKNKCEISVFTAEVFGEK